MLEKLAKAFTLNPETFDKHKSTLLITTAVSAVGFGTMALLEAAGVVDKLPLPDNKTDPS